MARARIPLELAIVALLLAGSACIGGFGQQGPSALQLKVGGTEMSAGELRARVRSLASPFSGEIEYTADSLAAWEADTQDRLQLLRFKINAVPQMQMALFRADPVAALVDAWALTAQMDQVFATLAERGEIRPEAEAELRARYSSMEDRLQELWRALTGRDVTGIRAEIDGWAKEHPITESLAARPSTVSLLADLTARSGVGALGAASILLDETQDLALRMDLLNVWAPKMARWQAQYFLLENVSDPTLLGTDPAALLRRASDLVDSMPELVDRERRAILAGLREERLGAQQFVTGERMAVLDALRGEREAILSALSNERSAAMADLDRLGNGWIDHAFDRAAGLVDRVLLFVLVLTALLVIGAVLVALIVARALRRRAEGGGTGPPP